MIKRLLLLSLLFCSSVYAAPTTNVYARIITFADVDTAYFATNGWKLVPIGVSNAVAPDSILVLASNNVLRALVVGANLTFDGTNLVAFADVGAGTAGDIIFRGLSSWTNLVKGVDGQVLKLSGGYPAWGTDNTGSGGTNASTVFFNGVSVDAPNFTNSSVIQFGVAGTNITVILVPAYQLASANLTNWSLISVESKQPSSASLTNLSSNPAMYHATNSNLALWEAIAPTNKQPASSVLSNLVSNPALYHASNVNLALWQVIVPSDKQPSSAALSNLTANPAMYHASNTVLARLAGIGAGTVGDMYYHNGAGWTNLPKGTSGQALKMTTTNVPAWSVDETGGGGESSGTVHNPDGATIVNRVPVFKDTTGTNITQSALLISDLQPSNSILSTLSSNPQLYQSSNSVLTELTGLVDPSINAIVVWDDVDNDFVNSVIGSGLLWTHSSHTLSVSATAGIDDTAFASSWNGVTTIGPSKNVVYDWGHLFDTDDDGKVNVLDSTAGMIKTDASGIVSVATANSDYLPVANPTMTGLASMANVYSTGTNVFSGASNTFYGPIYIGATGGSRTNVAQELALKTTTTGLNATTPAAPGGANNVAFQSSGASVSAYLPTNITQTFNTVNAQTVNGQALNISGTGIGTIAFADLDGSNFGRISAADVTSPNINLILPSAPSSGVFVGTLGSVTNVTMSISSALPLGYGGTGQSLTDPAANILYGWDDTDNAFTAFTIGSGLVYTHASHSLSVSASAGIDDTAFASSWNGVTTIGPSKNAVYDWAHTFDTDDDGKVNVLDLGVGMVKTDSGGVVSAGTAGVDYVAPGAITGSGLTMSTAKVLGRATGGSGAVEELNTTGTGSAVLSASPTLTGTMNVATITASGSLNSVNGNISGGLTNGALTADRVVIASATKVLESSGVSIDDNNKMEGVAALTMKLGTVTNNVPTVINVTFPPWNVSNTGVADQTAAIQAVIDYVGDLSYRVPIFFPAGIYRVDGTVNVDHTLTLIGQNSPYASAGTTILKNGTGAALNLSVIGIELRNFHIDCQDAAENRIGIALMGTTDASLAILDNIRVYEASVGVWCNNAWSSTLRNVISTYCTDALIISNNCSAISLLDCEFSSSMKGIRFASGAGAVKAALLSGLQIQHNDIGVYGTNTYLQNPTFLSCDFEANTNYDLFLSTAMAPLVQGCIFTGAPTARTNAYFAGVTNWVWTGNSYWDDTIPFSCDTTSKGGVYYVTFDGGGYANDPVIGATDAISIGSGIIKASSAGELVGPYNAATTGSTLKQTKHLFLMRPDYGDGAGAVPQTNNFTASGLMHYTFSGTAETNVNWVVYETIVPADIDTAVAMTATVAFVSGGTDADDVTFHLTYALGASGTALPTGTAIATSPIVVTKTPTTPASGDVQVSAATTLTAWAGSMTAGTPLLIRMARLNNDNDDSAREMYLDIAYGSTL